MSEGEVRPPQVIVLCPCHLKSLDFARCTPGTLFCAVDYVREMKRRGDISRPARLVIPDDIAALPLSRQRKTQLAWKRLGRCMKCGSERAEGNESYCLFHTVQARERQRKKQGSTFRKLEARSYKAERKRRDESD